MATTLVRRPRRVNVSRHSTKVLPGSASCGRRIMDTSTLILLLLRSSTRQRLDLGKPARSLRKGASVRKQVGHGSSLSCGLTRFTRTHHPASPTTLRSLNPALRPRLSLGLRSEEHTYEL